MSHLWSTYGVLQDYEVQENDVKMKTAISAETLFEDFVEKIETAVDAVATQVPYTREQIVSIAFTIVENAGIYYDGVKEWRRKYTADKKWEAFKTFFAREFREIRIQPRTSASEGFGTTVDRACKKVLCTLIPEAYFRSFKNKYTGYANVQCLEIMSHLWSACGVL